MAQRVALLFFCVCFAAACFVSSQQPPPGSTNDAGTASITFHKDVEPILQQHCQSCHVAGGIAPFPLVTYADAQPYAADIVSQTGARKMPPWGARNTSECTTRAAFRGDPSLTDSQIQLLSDWSTQGAVEGNIADAPPPYTPPPNGLAGEQQDLTPLAPFTLPATESQDEFVCFVIDPKITTLSYINGTAVLPGNPLIVHHAVIYQDPARDSLKLVTDQTTNSYSCFGGSNVAGSSLVTAWAPGGLPHEFPPNVGMPITPGSLLVMQVHYHPHTTDPKNQNPDVTHLQLRYTSAAPQYLAVSKIVGNFPNAAAGLQPGPDDPGGTPVFDIPANVSGHTETMDFTIPQTLTKGKPTWLYSVGGHMHLVGNDIKLDIARAQGTQTDPAQECLMQIPAWDFYWQRQYDYDLDINALPTLAAGDKMTIRCTYDNTTDNAALMSELTEQGMKSPVDVKLGETTLDEMCLAIVTAVTPAQ